MYTHIYSLGRQRGRDVGREQGQWRGNGSVTTIDAIIFVQLCSLATNEYMKVCCMVTGCIVL